MLYEPLQKVPDLADTSFYFQLGVIYECEGLHKQAEECFQTVLDHDEDNIEARIEMAKLYEKLGLSEQAFALVNEVIDIRNQPEAKQMQKVRAGDELAPQQDTLIPTTTNRNNLKKRKTRAIATPAERIEYEKRQNELISTLYRKIQALQNQMLAGEEAATDQWMGAALEMIDDFRSCKAFYPWDKYVRFLGYSGEAKRLARRPKNTQSEFEAMADRLGKTLGGFISPISSYFANIFP